jgi:choline dehydrogenase-like flavoprotein
MNVEDLRALPERAVVDADVCIVGSGPAGLTIARELNGSGLKVLVLESGGRDREPWSEALNTIESVGAPRVMDQALVRNRVLGGSSATWAGRAATFDELDFAAREWVPFSGWPITRAELEPYFVRSMQHLGLAVADNNQPSLVDLVAAKYARLDRQMFRQYAWTYSRHDASSSDVMRFGPQALNSRLDDVRCFVHATVTHIDTSETGDTVTRLQVHAPDRRCRWVTARLVVLCGGAIENARLLLASNRVLEGGVGNGHDVVGRFLMDHPRGPVGHFAPADSLAVQRLFGDFRLKGNAATTTGAVAPIAGPAQLTPGFALSPEIQESERMLNCAMWISGHLSDDDPLDSARDLVRLRRPVQSLRNVLGHPRMVTENMKRVLFDGRLALRSMSTVELQCIVEQRPDRDSRITLSERTDALGVPLSVIDWRIGDQEARTVRWASIGFAGEMRRLGLPVPVLLAMITDEDATFHLPDVAHPSGTTRMSLDPCTGVVDVNCAVHGVDGLFVAGSSVFPTNGHANPTQMIVAMAVRLADHLKAELDRRSPIASVGAGVFDHVARMGDPGLEPGTSSLSGTPAVGP